MAEEITTQTAPDRSTVPGYIWSILAVLTLVVYLYGLTLPFLGPDEARYAQVGREMLDRGDWVTPTLGGFPWFEKPALLYWLEIVFFKVFGVNEFAARLGPALFGLGTVVSLWILGKSLATGNTTFKATRKMAEHSDKRLKSSEFSVVNDFPKYVAVIASSTLGILVFSRGASFDIIITFPITAALVSFFIFDRSIAQTGRPVAENNGSDRGSKRRGRYLPLFLFYFFIGVSLLAKGLIGIVFPFAIVGFYYVLSWRIPSSKFLLSVVWGTLLAVAIALIWYWPVYHQNGFQFIEEFFIEHHFQRFTSNKYQHPQPFYFFLWVLPLMTLPWMPFFLAAIWSSLSRKFRRTGNGDTTVRSTIATVVGTTDSPKVHPFSGGNKVETVKTRQSPARFSEDGASRSIVLFAFAWILVPLVFFSFSGSKLPGYILPAVPGAIILTAIYIFTIVRRSKKWRNAILVMAATMLVLTAALLTFVVPRFADSDSVRSLIYTANDSGYASTRVLSLHTISYNAEFYAAGRLLRDETGKQRRLSGPSEVIAEIEAKRDAFVLVLVPLEYVAQLMKNARLNTVILKDNGELAIALVSLK